MNNKKESGIPNVEEDSDSLQKKLLIQPNQINDEPESLYDSTHVSDQNSQAYVGLSTEESQKEPPQINHVNSEHLLKKPSLNKSANLFSKLFFNWTVPLIYLAKKRRLAVEDFGGMTAHEQVQRKLGILSGIYQSQEKKSLLSAIMKSFKYEYARSFMIGVLWAATEMASPALV